MRINLLLNIGLFFCFFPSTLFFLTKYNQCQPVYGIFTTLIFIYIFFKNKKIDRFLSILLFIICFYSFINLFFCSTSISFIIVNACGLLFPITVYPVFKLYQNRINQRVVYLSILAWSLLGFHQEFIPYNQISQTVENILTNFIGPRFSMYNENSITEGRGSQFFTPEPASATGVLILFWALNFYFYRKNQVSKTKYYCFSILIFFLVYLNQSVTSFILFIPFLIYFFISTGNISLRWFFVLIIAVLVVFLLFSKTDFGNVRFAHTLISLVEGFGKNDMILLFNDFAGQRSFNFLYSYASICNNFGFGHLIDGWVSYDNFLNILKITKLNPNSFTNFDSVELYFVEPIKPWSYLALLVYCTGVVGLIPAMLFFGNRIKHIKIIGDLFQMCVLLTSAFLILFVPPTSSPVPWLMLSLINNKK